MIRWLVGVLVLMCTLLTSTATFAAGAIAVVDAEGTKASEVGYGVGRGDTREAAAADALKDCRKVGNTGCEVVVRYDVCGAYAATKKYAGKGWGSTEAIAKQKAMEECGDPKCRVVVSDCSE